MIKKVAAIVVLVMVVALSVAGCIHVDTPAMAPTPSPTATPSSAVALTVNSVTTSSGITKDSFESTPRPGNHFVIIDVTLTNLNQNDLYMGNLLYFRLTTNSGIVYSYSADSFYRNNTLSGQFHTNPGDTVSGQIAFETPQSATAASLRYSDGYNPPVTTNA